MNDYLRYRIAILFVFSALLMCGQNTHRRFAVKGGTAHTGDGRVIENSLLVVKDGKIEYIGGSEAFDPAPGAYDTVITATGKHIYPGLINANNVLGLHDAEAVRATRDYNEVGHLNPHVRALIAYNTDNIIIPTIKTNGILYTQVTPRSGLMSGSSSVMALEGWNWEDAVLKADDGIHLNYPKMQRRRRTEADEKKEDESERRYTEDILFITKFFADARAYVKAGTVSEVNLRFEALRPVFSGKANLYVHADYARDILSAIGLVRELGIPHPVLVGGKESWKVVSELKRHKIPVMLNRVNDLPDNSDDDIDIVFRIPYLLQKDSVLFCLQMEGDMEAMHSRNLPFNAGSAVAYGLTKEQALAAVTSNAAKILGINDRVGTLAAGMLASFVISDGDILDFRGNNIVMAWIAGKPVDLSNRQSQLYLRYKKKYGI